MSANYTRSFSPTVQLNPRRNTGGLAEIVMSAVFSGGITIARSSSRLHSTLTVRFFIIEVFYVDVKNTRSIVNDECEHTLMLYALTQAQKMLLAEPDVKKSVISYG